MPLQCATHWDALSHIFDHGNMWNGYSAEKVTSAGAALNGIERTTDKLISRGVLLDIARFKGVESLDDGYAISESDLVGCIEAQGKTSHVGTSDIILLRTGQLGRARAMVGADMREATPLASRSGRWIGSIAHRLPPLPAIPGVWRYVPTSLPVPFNRFTR